jgi:hypothetical protein
MYPTVSIENPKTQALIPVSQPLLVAGVASGIGGAEPSLIDSVLVSVAGSPAVAATLKHLPHHGTSPPAVTFSATVPFPDVAGFVEVVVTAEDDMGAKGRATVTVIGHESGAAGMTPQESLQIVATNPAPPSGDWATQIVKATRDPAADDFTVASVATDFNQGDAFPVCAREWTQVLAPGEDYDEDAVALSGWLLQPEISGNDFYFSHVFGSDWGDPYGYDWECMVALDSEFTGLLAAGNVVADGSDGAEAMADAKGLNIPVPAGGLLAIETDGGCVPPGLNPQEGLIWVGDRIAAYGRWIVDTGHSVQVNGSSSYRAEVHPPMLMAIGGTRTDQQKQSVTRVLLTSRPYLVKQVYTTDTGSIYDDAGSVDGTFLTHINNEIEKVSGIIPESLTIEAHPKVASKPFKGVHLVRIRVRPPAPSGRRTAVDLIPEEIQASFQFTCRSGVGVEVVEADGGVDILVSLNSVGYSAPALPPHQDRNISVDQLKGLGYLEMVASLFDGLLGFIDSEQALARGVDTDLYTVPDVDILDRSHAIPFTPVANIPGGQGIVVDDGQPYPVFGFLEIRRERSVSVTKGSVVTKGVSTPIDPAPPKTGKRPVKDAPAPGKPTGRAL